MVLGRITRGRHTDNLGGRHSISINQQSTSNHFTPNALLAATLPIYPGLEQAPNMLACIPSGLVSVSTKQFNFTADLCGTETEQK